MNSKSLDVKELKCITGGNGGGGGGIEPPSYTNQSTITRAEIAKVAESKTVIEHSMLSKVMGGNGGGGDGIEPPKVERQNYTAASYGSGGGGGIEPPKF
ncbi:hypothetical protein CBQ28_04560 [Pseudoalteromonas sp. GCY]|uniref:hypothetical protein n=1 Tax=unclassified Pseudoalteromonas TaxID=194690 RepID=UPI000BFF105F|nr:MULTISPECIES: hypothetical protein [unclassified Pseudoalteromonas]MCG7552108.1 hypothetical protein [Pseudoalteromonas sp. Of11M-6]PHI38357.1 hypothetical protein CBQ28_04560 [Pseudoalteromonas sp. GCY]QQQ65672.1 hypothetical protein JJQ94_15280 [Pseudoalteromonas sp. GCY]